MTTGSYSAPSETDARAPDADGLQAEDVDGMCMLEMEATHGGLDHYARRSSAQRRSAKVLAGRISTPSSVRRGRSSLEHQPRIIMHIRGSLKGMAARASSQRRAARQESERLRAADDVLSPLRALAPPRRGRRPPAPRRT